MNILASLRKLSVLQNSTVSAEKSMAEDVFTPKQQSFIAYWLSLPRRNHSLIPCKKDICFARLAPMASSLAIFEDMEFSRLLKKSHN